ncbi:MAG: DoxX-like family protein [Polyangiales bacterium]
MTRHAPSSRAASIAIAATGVAMIAVGALHFVSPTPFERIVPPWLPAARALVYLSGAAEIVLGIGVLVPRSRRWAALALIALYIAVFPANIHMAIHRVSLFADQPPPPTWALYARLPMQALLIANALWIARRSRANGASTSA